MNVSQGEEVRNAAAEHSAGNGAPAVRAAEPPVDKRPQRGGPGSAKAGRAAALTLRQRAILEYFVDRIRVDGLPPTVREIAAQFGIAVNAVHCHMRALVKKEALRQLKLGRRGYVPTIDRTCPCCGRKVRR
jgi:hypothetical protein